MGLAIIEPIGQIELEWQGTTLPAGLKTGMRVTTADGTVYRLVKNSLGATATKWLAYILRYNTTTGELTIGAQGDDALAGCVCIPQIANIADATYAWVATGGIVTYTAAGAISGAHVALSLSTTDGKLSSTAITGKFLNLFNGLNVPGGADVTGGAYCPGEMFYIASN